MRLPTRILYPLFDPHNGLGARSAPKRYCLTRRGLCRDIKGRALDWLVMSPDHLPAAPASLPLLPPADSATANTQFLLKDAQAVTQGRSGCCPRVGDHTCRRCWIGWTRRWPLSFARSLSPVSSWE